MNTNHYKYIITVAEVNSFSKAAELCNVTQPTLSNGVANLEELLGHRIFHRTTRKVVLTDFGSAIIGKMKTIIELEGAIHFKSKEYGLEDIVVFKVGVSPLVNSKFSALLTSSYSIQNKNQKIVLIEQDLKSLSEKLANNELDIIFVPKTPGQNQSSSLSLYEEPLYLLEKEQSASGEINIDNLKGKTFLMVPDSCGLSEITRHLLRTQKQKINEYEGKAMSYQVLADWASSGLGVAVLPKSKIPDQLIASLIYNRNKEVKMHFQAHWNKRNLKKVRALLNYIEAHSQKIYQGLS